LLLFCYLDVVTFQKILCDFVGIFITHPPYILIGMLSKRRRNDDILADFKFLRGLKYYSRFSGSKL